jgi:hypothetical protein
MWCGICGLARRGLCRMQRQAGSLGETKRAGWRKVCCGRLYATSFRRGSRAWLWLPGLMLRFARAMVGWHTEGGFWADVWQAPRWVISDELSEFVDTLYEASGAVEE